MEKLSVQTANLAESNRAYIAERFPNAITEVKDADGAVTLAVDFDVLRQELSDSIVDGPKERYQFTWPDKRKAIALANESTTKTLRPVKERSVGADGQDGGFDSKNIYIEGDNLDALKILRETYLGKVKMIYIDPPYNTGSDAFVYDDAFSQTEDEFAEVSGKYDEEGNIVIDSKAFHVNNETNGRFHTDWLNMIYPRLKIAKDLLSEDGVIFISIDDNEQENLKKVCDEIFGSQNFVAQLVWERAFSPKNDAKYISNSHDYILMFSKDIENFVIGRLPRTEEANARYSNPDNDPRGPWMSSDISVKTYNASCDYPITTPSGVVVEPPAGRCWSLSKNAFLERLQDNRIWFGPKGDGTPRIKRFLSDLKHDGMAPTSILFFKDVGHSQEGSQEVSKLLEGGYFSGPKPVRLLYRMLTLANLKSDSLVMDFFSGSGTLAQATLQYSVDTNKQIHSILVQLPEKVSEKDAAYKAGYKTICEIGEERIRRAGKRIRDEWRQKNELFTESAEPTPRLDVGFRVFQVVESNFRNVAKTPSETKQPTPEELINYSYSIKEGTKPESLLIQSMLSLGVPLSADIREEEIVGKQVFFVQDNYLVACFDKDVSEAVVEKIANYNPEYAVFLDSGIDSDATLANFDQIFERISPGTERRII